MQVSSSHGLQPEAHSLGQCPSLLFNTPRVPAPLDPDFIPVSLGLRAYEDFVAHSGCGSPFKIALERQDGEISTFSASVAPLGGRLDHETLRYAQHLVKFLLWSRGGWRMTIGSEDNLGSIVSEDYRLHGKEHFHVNSMQTIYKRKFEVILAAPQEVPQAHETTSRLGGNLRGCRIGFDLGASDIKVAALIDGDPVFQQEIEWKPKEQSDPAYHYEIIRYAIALAASHLPHINGLPHIDCIGGSAAGVYVNNQTRMASLFTNVPPSLFREQVEGLFVALGRQFNAPLILLNDGEVAALQGHISLKRTGIIGIAMGSSEGGGLITRSGHLTSWLNELCFTPVDFNPSAPCDTFSAESKDTGTGSAYFSQRAVYRLGPRAQIPIPADMNEPQYLKLVKELAEKQSPQARLVFETIGVHLGYTLAQYRRFYDFETVLLLGRVPAGAGGLVIKEKAEEVLQKEFPALRDSIAIEVPDSEHCRFGQAVAAATLPELPV